MHVWHSQPCSYICIKAVLAGQKEGGGGGRNNAYNVYFQIIDSWRPFVFWFCTNLSVCVQVSQIP